uniref:UEV domain-containing protein n=1 Tax=Macrostomum lignano TaxID=282301 RepID=A0A1I8GVG1_9PLAT
NYKHPEPARRDLANALHEYRDLRPTTESFTFSNGETRQLLALSGTIPVVHKGSTYNIPVCLYMQYNAPYDAPLVYVRPTASMEIRVSQYVDSNGRIYMPYLSSWTHPQSDLVGLIQMLQIQFGDTPPVVSRMARQAAPVTPMAQQQHQQPVSAAGGGYGWGAGYGWQQPPLPPQQQQQQQPQSTGTRQDYQEEAMRMSVLTAAEDKVRRRYSEKRAQLEAELDVVRRTGQDLREGREKLEKLLRGLETELQSVGDYTTRLRQANSQAEEMLTQMAAQESVGVDEAIDATAPLYRQIVRCYAEEQALEDTIFALGDALRKGCVDIDSYLKASRRRSCPALPMR